MLAIFHTDVPVDVSIDELHVCKRANRRINDTYVDVHVCVRINECKNVYTTPVYINAHLIKHVNRRVQRWVHIRAVFIRF